MQLMEPLRAVLPATSSTLDAWMVRYEFESPVAKVVSCFSVFNRLAASVTVATGPLLP